MDTSVLVASCLSETGASRFIRELWERGFLRLIVSPPIVSEYLARLITHVSPSAPETAARVAAMLIDPVRIHSIVAGEAPEATASQDPSDNWFLDAGFQGGASMIVSLDNDLLALQAYRAIRIVRPAEFLGYYRDVIEPFLA